VGRVARELVHLGAYVIALAIEFNPAASGDVGEDIPPGGAGGLVADKKYIVARIPEQGLEVVHHSRVKPIFKASSRIAGNMSAEGSEQRIGPVNPAANR